MRLLIVSVSVMCEFTQDSWKMYRYTLEERVFIVCTFGKQGLSKIWRAGFSPVWTQMVATSSTCYDAVTFLTQRTYSCSNFVAISSLVLVIKEMPGSVASGTPCTSRPKLQRLLDQIHTSTHPIPSRHTP